MSQALRDKLIWKLAMEEDRDLIRVCYRKYLQSNSSILTVENRMLAKRQATRWLRQTKVHNRMLAKVMLCQGHPSALFEGIPLNPLKFDKQGRKCT